MLASWPNIRKREPSRGIRKFQGVSKLDRYAISETYSPDTINRTINENGEFTTRPGYTVLGEAAGTRCLGLGVWKDTQLHAVFDDGTWRKWNVSDVSEWITLATGLDTVAEWTFTNFKGSLSQISLIGTNGVDSARYYDGTTVAVLSGVPAGANYITSYADRLWAAVGNELHASAYRIGTDWTTVNGDDADSWYTDLETTSGETINGIVPGMQKLIITKPSSTHKLMGYAPSDYTMQLVTESTGQFNNKSGLTLEGWLYQIDDTGFYRYAGGIAPERDFSQQVADYFGRISAAGKALSSLGTDGVRVYASFAVSGSVPDTMLVYDPKTNTFFEWNDISAVQFAQMGTDFYIGDAAGRVLKLGGTTDNGEEIEWYWTSIPYTGASMAQGVRFTRMWATVDLPVGSTMGIALSKSPTVSDWVNVGSLTAASDIQRKAVYVASNIVTNANQLRYKAYGTGPCNLHEVAWDQIDMPIR